MRLFLVLAVLSAGCADECLTAESHCDGARTIESCVQTDGFLGDHWGDAGDCPRGSVCVDVVDSRDGRRDAFCASSAEPDPRCPEGMTSRTGYLDRCIDPDTQLRCYFGYALEISCELGCERSSDGSHGQCARS